MIFPSKRPAAALAVAACALGLGACGLKLDSALKTPTPAGAFEAALHAGYLDLAQSEYDEADYGDSDGFAVRAMAVSAGKPVGPEELAARALPEDAVAALMDARGRLEAALAGGAPAQTPEGAARAQLMFDCWMQEQEENFQPGDIERCRSGFSAAMSEVDVAMAPPPPPPEPEPVDDRPRAWTLFFGFDSAALDDAARGVVDAIAAAWAAGTERLAVVGHADTAGPDSYNLGLSERRARAVGAALQEGGVADGRLILRGVGESDPAVSTGDGVPSAENRRVSVAVQ